MDSKNVTQTNLCDSQEKLSLLYLILSPYQNSWYRAIIKDVGATSDEYSMFCVDYGMSLTVNKKNMWRLDQYGVALSRYPYQAIQIKLYEVPVPTEESIWKLKELISPGMKLSVSIT